MALPWYPRAVCSKVEPKSSTSIDGSHMRPAHSRVVILLSLFSAGAFLPIRLGGAQEAEDGGKDWSLLFDKTEVMIAARDGVKLHTEIYAPKDAKEALPIVLERTPYGTNDDEKGFSRKLGRYVEMIPDDYIFVFQDIRGRYGSEGKFVMNRPGRNSKDPKAVEEGPAPYDRVDCVGKN